MCCLLGDHQHQNPRSNSFCLVLFCCHCILLSGACFWPKICTHGCLSRVSQGSWKDAFLWDDSGSMFQDQLNHGTSKKNDLLVPLMHHDLISDYNWTVVTLCISSQSNAHLVFQICNNWRLDHKLTRN